jgi:HJR/Mrr/RecB family endonuclease
MSFFDRFFFKNKDSKNNKELPKLNKNIISNAEEVLRDSDYFKKLFKEYEQNPIFYTFLQQNGLVSKEDVIFQKFARRITTKIKPIEPNLVYEILVQKYNQIIEEENITMEKIKTNNCYFYIEQIIKNPTKNYSDADIPGLKNVLAGKGIIISRWTLRRILKKEYNIYHYFQFKKELEILLNSNDSNLIDLYRKSDLPLQFRSMDYLKKYFEEETQNSSDEIRNIINNYETIKRQKIEEEENKRRLRENKLEIKRIEKEKIKLEKEKEENRKNKIKLKSIINDFQKKEEYIYILNFAKKFGTCELSSSERIQLDTLLRNKGIVIDSEIISLVLEKECAEAEYCNFLVFFDLDKDYSIEEILKIFLKHCNPDKEMDNRNLKRFLKEKIHYNLKNLSADLLIVQKQIEMEKFEKILIDDRIHGKRLSIEDIDSMNGYQFEEFLSHFFEIMGYSVENTPLSRDQGADLIISKMNEKTVVQAKRYSGNVGNSAIQEIKAAIAMYGAKNGIVVTNSDFTSSAKSLAHANNIELINREQLIKALERYFMFKSKFA